MSKHWALWRVHIQAPYCNFPPCCCASEWLFLPTPNEVSVTGCGLKWPCVKEAAALTMKTISILNVIGVYFIEQVEDMSRLALIVTGQECILVTVYKLGHGTCLELTYWSSIIISITESLQNSPILDLLRTTFCSLLTLEVPGLMSPSYIRGSMLLN